MVEYNIEDDLNTKLKHYFDGRIVRKDLTKRVKEGANVPVYVLEYLLGKYCSASKKQVNPIVHLSTYHHLLP